MQFIIDHIDISEPLVVQFLTDLQNLMKLEHFEKNQKIHTAGSICDKIYFPQNGFLRAYYYKEDKDITAHFAGEGSSVAAIDSFIQRKKSRYNIEALEKCNAFTLSYQDIQELLAAHPVYEKYIRLFLEHIYIELAERIEDLVFNTAKERYEKLILKQPTLFQHVNLGHIASYIGISQETLSRIRAQK